MDITGCVGCCEKTTGEGLGIMNDFGLISEESSDPNSFWCCLAILAPIAGIYYYIKSKIKNPILRFIIWGREKK